MKRAECGMGSLETYAEHWGYGFDLGIWRVTKIIGVNIQSRLFPERCGFINLLDDYFSY